MGFSLTHQRYLDPQAVRRLAESFHGQLIRPQDPGYDEARALWNGMIDRYPALIARAADSDDVVLAVNFARAQSLPLAVRGGGHNVAGHASIDNGLVIDLSTMNLVTVDPDNRLARVSGGATWGDVDAATQPYGLAAPGGVVSLTGVAGLTLGGGFGWLRNAYGLACDNLVAATVVLADGRVVRASADENPDLLWGLRGGGGNFGIVTEFTFQLHPVGPDVMHVFVMKDASGAHMAEALRFFRDFSETAPDAVTTLGATGVVPSHAEAYPVEIHGKPFVLLGAMYAGPAEEGRRVLQPLLDFGVTLADFSAVRSYVEAQQIFNAEYPDGMRYYWKSLNVTRLDDAVIDVVVDRSRHMASPISTVDLWYVGGAVKRVGPEASAFGGRQAGWLVNYEANWEDPADDAANLGWVQAGVDALKPFSDGSRYLNFAGFQEEGDPMMHAAFGSSYARLAALKARYDPDNLFRLNQNIRPAQPRPLHDN
jgi:FAD/FMN-containing dehydrogenase